MLPCARVKLLQSCPTLSNPVDCGPSRLLSPWDSPGKNTGVGCHALLQGIFLTEGSNPRLLSLLHWQVGSLPGKPDASLSNCSVKQLLLIVLTNSLSLGLFL